jgi:predicted MFS family arabinose efflux permease
MVEILFLELYRAIKMPIVGTILLLNFVTSFTIAIFNVAFQPYLVENLKLGQEYISYVLIVAGMINILFIGLVKIVTDRFDLYKVLNATFLLRFVSFGLIVLFSYSVTVFWISIILFALSTLLGRPVISSLLSKYGRPEDQGVILGSAESLFSLGLAVGPMVFSLLSIPKRPEFSFWGIEPVTSWLHTLAVNNLLSFLLATIVSLAAFVYFLYFIQKLKQLSPDWVSTKIDF